MKVLLIDDHPLILAALQSVIEGLGSEVTVVGVASARAARETLLADAEFDLVLLDLHLGDANGFDVLAELRRTYPALPVVVVSASDRPSDVIRAIDAGAMGFVPKRASNDSLFNALRLVMSGGIYVPSMAMGSDAVAPPAPSGESSEPGLYGLHARGHLPVDLSDSNHSDSNRDPHRHPQPHSRTHSRGHTHASDSESSNDPDNTWPVGTVRLAQFGLTPRQTEVLGLLLKGQPNKLIARELNVSVETVKDHVAAVLRALGVSTRTQAVIAVSQMSSQGGLAAWRTR